MFITLYKIGGMHFRLLGTNGFHVTAKNERFTAASSRCRQNLKFENFTSSFGRLRQSIAPKSVPHVLHDYFSAFNQSNHWFVALMLPSSNLKLPIVSSLLVLLFLCSRANPSLCHLCHRGCLSGWMSVRPFLWLSGSAQGFAWEAGVRYHGRSTTRGCKSNWEVSAAFVTTRASG